MLRRLPSRSLGLVMAIVGVGYGPDRPVAPWQPWSQTGFGVRVRWVSQVPRWECPPDSPEIP